MNNRTFYNEVLTDHNRYPGHKEKLADANLVLEGVNPSCGDDIVLQLRVEDARQIIFPHPTVSEVIAEAAHDREGLCCHSLPKKK